MAPTRRETRSRTSSPYTGRPDTRSKKDAQATPKAKQAQQEPLSRHRYGLRSMLSNLIWGSPVKAVEEEEESESGDEVDSNAGGDDDDDDAGFPPASDRTQQQAQVISDNEDEQEPETQPSSASTFESAPPRRFTAAEKGKGSPKRADSYSAAKYLPQASAFGTGLRSSQTFGDMRSIQRDSHLHEDIPTSTPNTSITNEEIRTSSPADVNSQLANFFAAKGTASLTADERRKISELLLSGNASAASSNPNVPTALTPNFSFSVPLPSASHSNVSILSPAYNRMSRSSTTSGGLSGLASRATGGLTGSQSLSSLSTLANGNVGPSSAAVNPRSALNRRQARPLYLGAGYSSQAIARRKRVQAQMSGGLFSNITSFDATPSSAPTTAATPGKRRRVGEEAESSLSVPAAASPSRSVTDLANAPPAFSIENTTPLTSTPTATRTTQHPALFQSAPHLRAQFASTPVKPSPLRNAAAAATPSPPAKAAEHSPPKPMSKTAGLMRGIVGDTVELPSKSKQAVAPAASASNVNAAPPSITMSRTSKPTTRVPREELIKRAEPPSAVEILERSMPPELRPTTNGKQARPKPPPVPGNARKTRAAVAASAETEKEDRRKTREQAKENLRVPSTRKSRSRSKTPDVVESSASSSKSATPAPATKLTAGKTTPEEPKQTSVSEDAEMDTAPAKSKSTAFNFSSGAPPTPAPSFFGTGGSKAAAPAVIEQPAPPKPLFAFSPPSQAPSSPAPQGSTAEDTSSSTTKQTKSSQEPAFKAMETSPSAFTLSSTPFDPKQEALKVPSVSLPTFTLYDTSFSFDQKMEGAGDDAGIKAIKQTVLEIPKNELVVFDLL